MAVFTFVSSRGDVLPLSDNPYFYLVNIDGQTSVSTSISSSVLGGYDGDTVNNIQAQPRTIVLDFRAKSSSVERSKREFLKVIKPKQNCALVWEQEERTVSIAGIVESIEMPRWNNGVTMQVSIHCENPFWEDIDYIIQQISEAIDLHYFTDDLNDMLYFPETGIPFGEYDTIRTKSFYNAGDVSVGLEINIVALGTVTNPIIYDADGRFFGIGYTGRAVVMETGDSITITTHRGNKTVTMNGVNVFDKIKPNSTWLQLAAGDNAFTINSDDESTDNVRFNLTYKQRYV